MSILGRIEVALAVREGNKQFRRELRENRAAGAKKNNEANKPSNNSTTNNHHKKNHNHIKSHKADNQAVDDKNPTVQKDEQQCKPEKNPVVQKPKTEQQINAEAEAPVEHAGAEQIKAESTVQTVSDANMVAPNHIMEPQAGVLNMNGICINTKDVMQPVNVPPQQQVMHNIPPMFNNVIPQQSGHVNQQVFNPANGTHIPSQIQNPIPTFAGTGGPMIPNGGFHINPVPGMDTYNQHLNNTPPVGVGHHKVDNPPQAKPQKPPKATQDNVDMTGMPDLKNGMEVQKFEKIDARTHGVLEDKISKEVERVSLKSVFATNEALYHDYPYLAEVEKVALDNGYQISFVVRPNTGLIDCNVANADGQYIDTKGFVIDPGLIIDRRKKVFPGLQYFYEGANAYPLFINSNVKDGKKDKKSANIFNEELIKTLIIGGNDAVPARGMYTEDFRNLNAIVALITIPTDKNGPSDRTYIQNRLIDLYKSGVFNEALAINPNARFRIMDYNSSSGTIILDSAGVTKNFGGQYFEGEHIQFKITKDKCKMLRGENIINPIEKK